MDINTFSEIFSAWSLEIKDSILKSKALCIALFSVDKELLFSNEAYNELVGNRPIESLLNPSFDKLVSLNSENTLIFDGYITFGSIDEINSSIEAQVYRKDDKLLLLGGKNNSQLIEQNLVMFQLNEEINNLQRRLIKKTHHLEEALLELEKMNIDKDRFLKIISHDLKNPFNTLLGFSQLLLKNIHKYDRNKIEKQLKIINQAMSKTYVLLDDLVIWSKSQSGKLPFNPQKLNFNRICQEVIYSLEGGARFKNISIKLKENESINLFVDYNMMKTILRNLISNAIKFTDSNGSITIYSEKKEDEITITVSDNGRGISEEDKKKLWQASEEYSTLGTNKEKGTGLGLKLCKEFVEKNGGRIWVESELGKGSKFKFSIPSKD